MSRYPKKEEINTMMITSVHTSEQREIKNGKRKNSFDVNQIVQLMDFLVGQNIFYIRKLRN